MKLETKEKDDGIEGTLETQEREEGGRVNQRTKKGGKWKQKRESVRVLASESEL